MVQARENSSPDHQCEELKVLVNIAERVLLLEASNNRLPPGQLSCFVELLNNLVGVFQYTFLCFFVFVHQLENLFFTT